MILPHVSDPFALLAAVAPLARETVVITQQAEQIISAYARWMPQAAACLPDRAWWSLSEGCLSAMLAVVGFEVERVTKRGYRRDFEDRDEDCTTFVARRRAPDELPSGTVMLSRAGTTGVRWPADHQDRVLTDTAALVDEQARTPDRAFEQVGALGADVRRLRATLGRLGHLERENGELRAELRRLRKSRIWRLALRWWRLTGRRH